MGFACMTPKDIHILLLMSSEQGLCSELKHLYVAVTRAKKNLWIVESNKSSVKSIVALWTSTSSEQGRTPLVSIVDVDEPEVVITC